MLAVDNSDGRYFYSTDHCQCTHSMRAKNLTNKTLIQSKKSFIILIVLIFELIFVDHASAVSSSSYFEIGPVFKNILTTSETENIDDENNMSNYSSEDFRLPHTLFPHFYDLSIQVHLHDNKSQAFFFNGSVTVKVFCNVSTTEIFVHAYKTLDVKLDKIQMVPLHERNQTSSIIEIEDINYFDDAECYRIKLKMPLRPNTYYNLTFGQFCSDLNYVSEGLYLSRYLENGVYEYLASTQLEANYARRVFPCWDEPEFKAKFKVNIIRHKSFHSLSNMNLESTKVLYDNWRLDTYNTSVKMSTYLLAIVVSRFSNIQRTDNRGRNFTVWARPEKIRSAEYALDVGIKLLENFEDYFGIPYSLHKMDMIAIPNSSITAMENWGLITFRENLMLWNPENGSIASPIDVASTVSHELSHQWFGNIVTMKWWDNLWLNEGFATYMEYIGVQSLHPEWKVDELFILDELIHVLRSDTSKKSRPVIFPANTTTQIERMFDLITYSKKYLIQNQYKNTNEKDLWKALSNEWNAQGNHLDIEFIMDSWTKQMNYPLVIVRRYGSNMFCFEQTRYLKNCDNNSLPEKHEYSWIIPITYGSAKTVNWTDADILWMVNKTMNQTMNISSDDWYLLNVRQEGLYRVHYADNNWKLLVNQLQRNFMAIPVYSRTQILNDLFSLANHHIVQYTLFLNATKYLNRENQFIVWITSSRAFRYINSMLVLNENYDVYQAYLRTLLDNQIRSVNWSFVSEVQHPLKMRSYYAVIKLACIAEHHLCVNKTTELFKQWMSEPKTNPIRPDLRLITYCTAIRFGGQKEWKFLKSQLMLNDSVNEEENEKKVLALACSRDVGIMKKHLNWVRENKEFWDTLYYFAQSPVGNRLLWDYLSDIDNFVEQKDFTKAILNTLIEYRYLVYDRTNYEKILVTEDSDQIDPELQKKIEKLLQKTRKKKKWTEDFSDVIIQWLYENVPVVTHLL
ncbi:unnamed protein product [Schistosoma rodhaini]|uniref:Aminopeptidase n=1 Tax=Schistosoma rodhaini TaxID=6188 RepID=A0AA85EZK0_9TREM|nr:unnamed protein product [Schistosoma rodhaini]